MRLALALCLLPLPALADIQVGSWPIYDHILAFPLPDSFSAAYESENGASYLRELTLKGESVEAWSQLVTMTGFKGGTGQMTLEHYASLFVDGYAKNCPETFGAKQVNWPSLPPIPGAEEQVGIWMGCGTVEGISEEVAVVFMASGPDILTLQWAARGPAGPQKSEPDWTIWDPRFEMLFQARVCAAGEAC